MRQRDIDRKMFHRGHWEVLAGRFREQLKPLMIEADAFGEVDSKQMDKVKLQRATLIDFAIIIGKRLAFDNADFDGVWFMDRCSPDPDLYPLSELWPGVTVEEMELT